MASTKRHLQEDDIISHFGSMSGETFASRRSRRDCSVRMTSTDLLAKNLREYHAKQENGEIGDGAKLGAVEELAADLRKERWNKSFHHFRILVVMMGGVSVGLMLLMRYSMTISILKMVNQTHLYLEEHPNRTVEDFLAEGYQLGGEFNWNNEIVAIILSWYMLSYTLPQVPLSRLSVKMGCRLSVAMSISLCAISILLTPWVAYFGWKWVVVLRLVNGLGASAVLPMLMHLVEVWMRYDDISFGLSIAQTLNTCIVTLTPLIAGYLAEIHWKYAFYIPGAFSLAFCVMWLILVADDPESSKFISTKELLYIREIDDVVDSNGEVKRQDEQSAVAPTSDKKEQEESITSNKVVTTLQDELAYKPDSWTAILKVPSFYAHIIIWCFFCSSYCGFNFILPTYLRQFLKIPVSQNGFFCFIIQIGGIVSSVWPHPILRMLQGMGLSVTAARIVAHAICSSMSGATWLYVGAFHDTQLFMLFLNRCFHGTNDIIVTGALMSNYAKAGLSSLAFSLVNTIGNLSTAGFSTFVGWTLDYTRQSREGWSWIFGALGVFQIVMFVIFAFFVDSKPIKFKNKRQSLDPANQGRDAEERGANNGASEQARRDKEKRRFDILKQGVNGDEKPIDKDGKES